MAKHWPGHLTSSFRRLTEAPGELGVPGGHTELGSARPQWEGLSWERLPRAGEHPCPLASASSGLAGTDSCQLLGNPPPETELRKYICCGIFIYALETHVPDPTSLLSQPEEVNSGFTKNPGTDHPMDRSQVVRGGMGPLHAGSPGEEEEADLQRQAGSPGGWCKRECLFLQEGSLL